MKKMFLGVITKITFTESTNTHLQWTMIIPIRQFMIQTS
jgi:hypothetical protein